MPDHSVKIQFHAHALKADQPHQMAERRPTQDATFQLYRLPKEKPVLDFVLSKLCEGASPDRYEIIDSLLNMYRTSTGFDPFAMSKGRFKRMKASEFKQILFEIDREIGTLLQNDEYKLYLAKQSGYEELFREYLEMERSVAVHPALSITGELEVFEKKCEQLESPEALLSFYRRHVSFLEEINRTTGAEKFLERYDALVERQRQLQRQFRLGFELITLEQAADKGLFDEEKTALVLQELGTLLTLEKQPPHKYSLLLKIIRAATLTATPARNLSPYLDFMEDAMDEILIYRPEAKRILLTTLAQYKINAGKTKRLEWLEEAEKEAKLNELHDERPGLRFVRCMAEADAGDLDAALRCLNEVEHLIYKASSRSLAARNNWIRLSELKTLLFTLKALQGDTSNLEQLTLLQQLAEDMGRHRQEIATMILEWKGLQHFLNNDFEDAAGCFDRAKLYRKNSGHQPWELIDKFFHGLLSRSKKKNETAQYALLLQEMQEPFYSSVCSTIMKEAAAKINASVDQQ